MNSRRAVYAPSVNSRIEQAAAERELQRELAEAREELARAVGDVARVSAEITRPVLRDVERNLRFMVGAPVVLGLNIEDSDFGVFVSGVTPNGPAATAGVTVGDTIVSINDVELAAGERGRSARRRRRCSVRSATSCRATK